MATADGRRFCRLGDLARAKQAAGQRGRGLRLVFPAGQLVGLRQLRRHPRRGRPLGGRPMASDEEPLASATRILKSQPWKPLVWWAASHRPWTDFSASPKRPSTTSSSEEINLALCMPGGTSRGGSCPAPPRQLSRPLEVHQLPDGAGPHVHRPSRVSREDLPLEAQVDRALEPVHRLRVAAKPGQASWPECAVPCAPAWRTLNRQGPVDGILSHLPPALEVAAPAVVERAVGQVCRRSPGRCRGPSAGQWSRAPASTHLSMAPASRPCIRSALACTDRVGLRRSGHRAPGGCRCVGCHLRELHHAIRVHREKGHPAAIQQRPGAVPLPMQVGRATLDVAAAPATESPTPPRLARDASAGRRPSAAGLAPVASRSSSALRSRDRCLLLGPRLGCPVAGQPVVACGRLRVASLVPVVSQKRSHLVLLGLSSLSICAATLACRSRRARFGRRP